MKVAVVWKALKKGSRHFLNENEGRVIGGEGQNDRYFLGHPQIHLSGRMLWTAEQRNYKTGKKSIFNVMFKDRMIIGLFL